MRRARLLRGSTRRAARVSVLGLAACAGAVAVAWPAAEVRTTVRPHSAAAVSERVSFATAERLPLSNDRDLVVRSVLHVPRPLTFGEYVWRDAGVPPGDTVIRVDVDAQTISVFRAGHEIGTAIILYGADNKPTPRGIFPILEKRAQHRSNLYDAEMPFMLRLTNDGIAVHGSMVRRGAATHGCIGLPLEFARALFDAVTVGDQVAIAGSPPDQSIS